MNVYNNLSLIYFKVYNDYKLVVENLEKSQILNNNN